MPFLRDHPGDFPYRQSRVEILVELTSNRKNTPRNYTIHVLGLIGVGVSVAFWWMSFHIDDTIRRALAATMYST